MLDITLSIIVFVIALIQLLRDKPEDEEKVVFNRFSWTTVLMVLLILSSVMGIVKSVLDSQESAKLQTNVNSIVTGVEDLDSLIEQSIRSIDSSASTVSSLTAHLDSVKIKTEKAIENWNQSLITSEELATLLERKLESEKNVLLASKPHIICLNDDLKFVELDSNEYKFIFNYKNFGGRPASDIRVHNSLYFFDTIFNQVYHFKNESTTGFLPPYDESGVFVQKEWTDKKFTEEFVNSTIRWGYAILTFKYSDPVLLGPEMQSVREIVFIKREKRKIKFYDFEPLNDFHSFLKDISQKK